MDLERLQVVISAKTDQLQKEIKNVVDSLKDVGKANTDIEDGFNSIANSGVDAFNRVIKASREYYNNIQSVAKYMAKNDIWETTPPTGQP